MASELRCPKAHTGPWRFVEAIEVWRDVTVHSDDTFVVNCEWNTAEGYNDGIDGTAYLLCWATDDDGHCAETVELPEDATITWA